MDAYDVQLNMLDVQYIFGGYAQTKTHPRSIYPSTLEPAYEKCPPAVLKYLLDVVYGKNMKKVGRDK